MYTGEFLMGVKEQIRTAMEKSQIVDFEDEEGNPIYKTVEKTKAVEKVMELFDSVAYQFMLDNSSALAAEEIQGVVKGKDFQKYMVKMNEILNKQYDHYKFEHDEDMSDTFTVIDGGKKD